MVMVIDQSQASEAKIEQYRLKLEEILGRAVIIGRQTASMNNNNNNNNNNINNNNNNNNINNNRPAWRCMSKAATRILTCNQTEPPFPRSSFLRLMQKILVPLIISVLAIILRNGLPNGVMVHARIRMR